MSAGPYGVYDPTRNEGWGNGGTDHDTAAFAVASIRGCWQSMGRHAHPDATELLLTADGGGSNTPRLPSLAHAAIATGRHDGLDGRVEQGGAWAVFLHRHERP
jgi:hypothetical protein